MQALKDEGASVQAYRSDPLDGKLCRISAPLWIVTVADVLDPHLSELGPLVVGDSHVDHSKVSGHM